MVRVRGPNPHALKCANLLFFVLGNNDPASYTFRIHKESEFRVRIRVEA